jgi:hypothetical protein
LSRKLFECNILTIKPFEYNILRTTFCATRLFSRF